MKKKILDLGEQLFLNKGYAGFSYADISAALSVKNAAIHYHFPSKKDLAVSILKRELERFQKWSENQEVDDASRALERAIEDIYEKRLLKSGQVCMIGNTAASYENMPLEAIKIARELIFAIASWFEHLLSRGREQGVFNFSGSPAEEANLIAASLSGALQLSRITGKDYFYSVKHQIGQRLKNG